MDAEAVQHAYTAIAGEYLANYGDDLDRNEFDKAVVDHVVEQMVPGRPVLDLACGPGQVAGYLADLGLHTVGLDLTPAMLVEARAHRPDLAWIGGELGRLPFRTGAAGGALARFVLHHVARPTLPAVLAEVRRTFAVGAPLLLGVQAGEGEEDVERVWEGQPETFRMTYYEADELRVALEQHGFVVDRVDRRPAFAHEHPTDKLYVAARAA